MGLENEDVLLEAKLKKARFEANVLEVAIENYLFDVGELPVRLNDLVQLPRGGSDPPWRGPYLISEE